MLSASRASLALLLCLLFAASSIASSVPLLDFLGTNPHTTSKTWSLTNDPVKSLHPREFFSPQRTHFPFAFCELNLWAASQVMGGVSHSNFTIDQANAELVWDGEVRVVPKLNAPGFCNLMSQVKEIWDGFYPSAVGQSGLVVRARSNIPYAGYKFSFGTISSLFLQVCGFANVLCY